VSSEGSREFMLGITEDMDQKMREDLLDITKDDIQQVAQRCPVNVPASRQASCVLGQNKNWIGDGWTTRQLKISE
jgi:presequence protease